MIRVGKLRSVYVVARDAPWPHAARERLDAIARSRLPATIANAVAAFSAARDDNSIWMLRRLQMDFDLKLDADDDVIAVNWAHQLLKTVVRRIDGGPGSDDIVRFSDEADLLRSFLVAAAAGRTDKWYYQRFQGLEYLSTTAKIRTAIGSNSLVALDAILRMTPHDLRVVVAALSDSDAHRIWDSLSGLLPLAPVATSLTALLNAWVKEGRPTPDGAGEFRWSLNMALAALREVTPETRTWIAAARPVGRLLMLLSRCGRDGCGTVLDAIENSRPLDLRPIMAGDDLAAIEPLLGCPRDVLESFLESRPDPQEHPERRYTPFGGVFLLLPSLDAVPVPRSIAPASLFRFWILLKCLGTARAVRVFEDPVVRALFDVDPDLSAEAFRRWQRSISMRRLRISRRLCLSSSVLMRQNSRHRTPTDRAYLRLPRHLSSNRDIWVEDTALIVVRALAWRLPGFSTASLPYLFENFLDFPAAIEEHQDRRLVRLGAPPLQLLLNMTGICRWQYAVTWLGGKRFELYPEAP